jgi:hypothetical protein
MGGMGRSEVARVLGNGGVENVAMERKRTDASNGDSGYGAGSLVGFAFLGMA